MKGRTQLWRSNSSANPKRGGFGRQYVHFAKFRGAESAAETEPKAGHNKLFNENIKLFLYPGG
jgi:hypothetical protein